MSTLGLGFWTVRDNGASASEMGTFVSCGRGTVMGGIKGIWRGGGPRGSWHCLEKSGWVLLASKDAAKGLALPMVAPCEFSGPRR